jgi:hypothetical protein
MINFAKFNGYQRLAVILVVAWFILAGAMYISSLGTYAPGPTYWEKMPIVVALWERFCVPIGIPVFGLDWGPEGPLTSNFFEYTFHPVGFLLFLLIPGAMLALAIYGIHWVLSGFGRAS